jgi:hypothetical protein
MNYFWAKIQLLRTGHELAVLLLLFFVVACNKEKVEDFPFTFISVIPESGSTDGNDLITIKGQGMEFISKIEIGGKPCNQLVKISSELVSCETPANIEGSSEIVLTNIIGTVAIGSFKYRSIPKLLSVQPSIGHVAGGELVTITGTGLKKGATVTFDEKLDCGSLTYIDSETLTCISPARATTGSVWVTVNNPDSEIGRARLFTYRLNPVVTSIYPTGGSITGFTLVTIRGSNFAVGSTVSLGGVNCNTVYVVNSTTLTCITGASAAATVDVVVSHSGLTGGAPALYTYAPAPTIASFIPLTGFSSGGTSVTITGNDFIAGAEVRIGGVVCPTTAETPPTSITCLTTSGPIGAQSVTVENIDQQIATSSSFTFVAAPLVSSITPNKGPLDGGTIITITGNYFDPASTVTVGGDVCTGVLYDSATQLRCTTPLKLLASNAPVVVTNPDTQLSNSTISYDYRDPPNIISVSPTGGRLSGGNTVTINGTGFLSGATVEFGAGSACTSVNVVSNLLITCVVPSKATAGPVTVRVVNDDLQPDSLVGGYLYSSAPTITSITPNSGIPAGGNTIVITGTNFYNDSVVSIGSTDCTSTLYVNPTTLHCLVPGQAAGDYSVTVTNLDTQQAYNASGYTYVSQALLQWDVGVASPNPPDPDSYGITNANTSHTYTLSNRGDLPSSSITLSITGAGLAGWSIVSETCTSAPLAALGNCTVQLSFNAATISQGSYSASLEATATDGGTVSNSITGIARSAVLEWTDASYDFGVTSSDVSYIFTLTNTGTVASSPDLVISESDPDSAWTMSDNLCTGTSLAVAATCTVKLNFDASSLATGDYDATISATASTGGTASVPFGGSVPITVTTFFSWLPLTYDFGPTALAATPTQIFKVTNNGLVQSGALTISLSSNAEFTVLDDDCTPLPNLQPPPAPEPLNTCNVEIMFSPLVSNSVFVDTLHVSDTLGNTASVLIQGSTP